MLHTDGVTLALVEQNQAYREAVEVMRNLPYDFYLTGSHYFGCATPDSDVDFIAEYDSRLSALLNKLEQRDLTNDEADEDYNRSEEFVDVFHLKTSPRIDIVLVAGVHDLRKARDIMRAFFAEEHRLAKPQHRTDMWQAALSLVKAVKGESP